MKGGGRNHNLPRTDVGKVCTLLTLPVWASLHGQLISRYKPSAYIGWCQAKVPSGGSQIAVAISESADKLQTQLWDISISDGRKNLGDMKEIIPRKK